MKPATLIALSLLLPPVIGGAVAQPLLAAPLLAVQEAEDHNAALVYYQIWLTLSADDDKIITDWYGNPKTYTDPISKNILDALARNTATIDRLAAATAMPTCDFGLEWNRGLQMPLAHLAKMRMSARWLAADAVRLRAEKRPDLAAARLAAVFNLARHCQADGVVISSLVSAAIGSLGAHAVTEHLDNGGFDPEQRALILQAARALRADGFNLFAAVTNEEKISVDWIQANYKSKTAGKDFMKDYGQNFTTPDDKDEAEMRRYHAAVVQMDGPALAAELNKLRPYFKVIRDTWNAEGAQDQLAALERRNRAGEFGTMAKLLAPAVSKVKAGQIKCEKLLDEAITRLEQPAPPAK